MLKLLNVGCGPSYLSLTEEYKNYQETRLDIDEKVNPDVVGTLQNIPSNLFGQFDIVVSEHNLEHIYQHEVVNALENLRKCLKENGVLKVKVPDLETVMQSGLNLGLDAVLYSSGMGDITARDILFGHEKSVESGNEFMQHRTGFTTSTLTKAAVLAGFKKPLVWRYPLRYELYMEAKNAL